jgi:uncharacterized protein (TIGR00266 family)
MITKIFDQGAFASLEVELAKGESIKAESGAMVSMDANIELTGNAEGGLLGGLGRMLAGEKFFLQTITANNKTGKVMLAPTMLGNIQEIDLNDETFNVQKDGFFAGEAALNISTKMQNLTRGLFSGEGFFVLKISGTGKLFVSSFGGIVKIDIPKNSEYIVDNSHLVAWPDSLDFKIEKASKSWLNSIKSGEGLVVRFKGPGSIYIQTRNSKSFGSWIKQFIPSKS